MNKKFVYQVGNNKNVILWCTANQISRRYLMFYNFIDNLFCLVQFMSVNRIRKEQEKRIWLSWVINSVIISVTVTLQL